MGVKVEDKMPSFVRMNEAAMERALKRMRNDIFVLSQFKVPKEDGELQASGEQMQRGRLKHRIQYGARGAQGYAGYQHRGMRKDGSRVVKRYTTAGTGKQFLSDSGKIIAPKSGQYFKREAESVRV